MKRSSRAVPPRGHATARRAVRPSHAQLTQRLPTASNVPRALARSCPARQQRARAQRRTRCAPRRGAGRATRHAPQAVGLTGLGHARLATAAPAATFVADEI
jgi:hypothetical protein